MNADETKNRETIALSDSLVAVLAGSVWITGERRSSDIILREGQSMKLRGRGWVLQGLPGGAEPRIRTWPILHPGKARPAQPRRWDAEFRGQR